MKERIKFNNKEYVIIRKIVDKEYGNILKCVNIESETFEKVYITKLKTNGEEKVDIIKDKQILKYLNEKYDECLNANEDVCF